MSIFSPCSHAREQLAYASWSMCLAFAATFRKRNFSMPCQAEGSTLSTGTGSVDSSSESQDGERLLKRSRCRSAFPKTIEMGCVKCSLSCFSNSMQYAGTKRRDTVVIASVNASSIWNDCRVQYSQRTLTVLEVTPKTGNSSKLELHQRQTQSKLVHVKCAVDPFT